MASPKNISPADFRKYLQHKGLKHIRTQGSHEVWSRRNLLRPVIFQTSKDPIPLFVVKSNLRTLGESIDDLLDFISNI